jgi:hypothetical protein
MKLTDTQLVILSAASQREDRGVELPPKLKSLSLRACSRAQLAVISAVNANSFSSRP